jgi:hypothetical protein
MAERTAWRICRDNGWWSAFGKQRGRGKNAKAGPPVHDDLVRRNFTADGPMHLAAVAPGVRPGLADGLPTLRPVEPGPGLGPAAPHRPGRARRQRRTGLVAVRRRLRQPQGHKRGPLTGPNPTDRGKNGSKIHLITDRNGLPLSLGISGADMHDSLGRKPLVQGSHRSAPGAAHAADDRPSFTPTRATTTTTCADGSASEASAIASPAKASSPSQRLGRHRWVVERTASWLAGCTGARDEGPAGSAVVAGAATQIADGLSRGVILFYRPHPCGRVLRAGRRCAVCGRSGEVVGRADPVPEPRSRSPRTPRSRSAWPNRAARWSSCRLSRFLVLYEVQHGGGELVRLFGVPEVAAVFEDGQPGSGGCRPAASRPGTGRR